MSDPFEKFGDFLGGVHDKMTTELGNALERSGEIVRKNIVKGIRDQSFGFAPLKPRTMEAKLSQRIRSGHIIGPGSSLILIDQGDYLASFTVVAKNSEVMIGTNHPQARALEFGYEPRNLVARPHCEPGLKQSEEEVKEEMAAAFRECFKFDK